MQKESQTKMYEITKLTATQVTMQLVSNKSSTTTMRQVTISQYTMFRWKWGKQIVMVKKQYLQWDSKSTQEYMNQLTNSFKCLVDR